MSPLLEVRDWSVTFQGTRVVDQVSFALAPGEALGLVGESGSGKSVTALSLFGLAPGAEVQGSARFEGRELLGRDEEFLRGLRGRKVGFVFQEPQSALNPALRVGEQVAESLRVHQRLGRAARRARAVELLRRVGVPAPEARVDAWPHELSGGLRQRALIASALACGPSLLVADEPTTALDVTVQAQVLDLLGRLRREDGLAVLLISHDLGLVAEFCDSLAVTYAGRVVEAGPAAQVLAAPRHPYTRALLKSAPRAGLEALQEIPGQVPDPTRPPPGCRFHPRCAKAEARCAAEAPPETVDGARRHRCHFPEGGAP